MTEPSPATPVEQRPGRRLAVDGRRGARRAARRGLATAVLACLVGAGLALFAVTRTWTTTTQRQAPPLPAKLVDHTGASLIGWLPALALVGLAGAGALLATRGRVRTIIGLLLVLVGLGVVAGAIDGLDIAAGAWPVIVGVGGLGIAWAGLSAMRSGTTWPAMGARYERRGGPPRSRRRARRMHRRATRPRGTAPGRLGHAIRARRHGRASYPYPCFDVG